MTTPHQLIAEHIMVARANNWASVPTAETIIHALHRAGFVVLPRVLVDEAAAWVAQWGGISPEAHPIAARLRAHLDNDANKE